MPEEFNLFPEMSYLTSKLRNSFKKEKLFFIFESFQSTVNFSAVSNQKTLKFYLPTNSNSDLNFSYSSVCLKYFM
jgi:hypothetical protein